jgi:hypothetical protein
VDGGEMWGTTIEETHTVDKQSERSYHPPPALSQPIQDMHLDLHSVLFYSFTISIVFHFFFLNQSPSTTSINDIEVSILFSVVGHSVRLHSWGNIASVIIPFFVVWATYCLHWP